MKVRGKFLVIEGPDGSGKGTQHKLLVERLQKNNIPVVTVDFPQYETSLFGEMVGNLLAGKYGEYKDYHPVMSSLVYAADRWKSKSIIEDNLRKGVNVVANRYSYSNMVYQSARLPQKDRAAFIKFINELEHGEKGFNIPRPDRLIILDVPQNIASRLIRNKASRKYLGEAKLDQLEADSELQSEAAKMYRYISKKLPDTVLINCRKVKGGLKSIEEIHELIWKEVKSFLAS